MNSLSPQISKYKISRRGRKLQISDDTRTLVALPKDVPERTWAEILQKEENDLIVFDIREEILEEALRIGYENYMERQNSPFAVFCATQAWLNLIDWQFYRHDPGEEPSAHPPCYIPNRIESWIPDDIPDPSSKDSWCKQDLNVVEDTSEETVKRWPSSSSLDYPVVEPIPQEYWFPGKVKLYTDSEVARTEAEKSDGGFVEHKPLVALADISGVWDYVQDAECSQYSDLGAESELLQKITDYSTEEVSKKESTYSALKTTTPVEGSLQGAGDSTVVRHKKRPEKSRTFSRNSVTGRSRGTILPPLDSRSHISAISDCRLRNLRLDTQYEISSEKVDTPPGEMVKRK